MQCRRLKLAEGFLHEKAFHIRQGGGLPLPYLVSQLPLRGVRDGTRFVKLKLAMVHKSLQNR